MTTSAANELVQRPPDVGGLFERLIEVALAAMEALQDEDFDQFASCMADRQTLIDHHASDASNSIADPAPADRPRLLQMARRLEVVDARLALAVASCRDEIARRIEAVDHGEAARSAYSGGVHGRGVIDIVR